MLKKIFKYLGITILNFFNHIKYKFKKRDYSIVVFGAWGGKTFSDNSRFLFQYLSKNADELCLSNVVWITEENAIKEFLTEFGYQCYLKDSKEAKRYLKKAGYHLVCCGGDDIGGKYSYNAIKINLWHGLAGIKGVNFASNEYLMFKKQHPLIYKILLSCYSFKFIRKNLVLKGGWNDCYYISTTRFETELMRKYFALPDSNFIEASYARLCPCVKLLPEEEKLIEKIKDRKVILYLPTFRNKDAEYVVPTSDKSFNKFLEENNILWIEKKHAVAKSDKFEKESINIIRLDAAFDINVIVPYVKVVVSDYSSVVFDALYHNIPVFFYTPDINYYADADRGFVLPIDEFMFGKQASTVDELKNLLEKYNEDFKASMPKNIDEFRDKFWNTNMGYEEIWNRIKTVKK